MRFHIRTKRMAFFLFTFLPIIKCYAFQKNADIDAFFDAWLVLATILLVSKAIKIRLRIAKDVYWIFVFFLMYLVSTFINTGVYFGAIAESLRVFDAILFLEIERASAEGIEQSINRIAVIAKLYLYIDTISIIYSNIMSREVVIVSFLGLDNYAIFSIIPMLCIILYDSISRIGRVNTSAWSVFLISFLTKIYTGAVSAIIAFLTFLTVYMLIYKRSQLRKIFTEKKLLWGIMIITVGVVFFNIQKYFGLILIYVFQRDVTLTTRTYIWSKSIAAIKNSLIYGYGATDIPTFKTILSLYSYEQISHTHNYFIELVFRTGIIGTAIYLYGLWKCVSANSRKMDTELKSVLLCGVAAFFILTISDAYFTIPWIYTMLYLCPYAAEGKERTSMQIL